MEVQSFITNVCRLLTYIGDFYFSLGNMKPCYRSTTNMVFLIALCKVPILKKFGVNIILEPFMQDIKHLEAMLPIIIMESPFVASTPICNICIPQLNY